MIFLRTFILIGVALLSGVNTSSAQEKTDTTKPKVPLKIASFNETSFSFGNKAPHDSIRYALDSFQIVHPVLITTGNLGAPGHYLIPRYLPAEPFSVRPDAFAYFGFNRYNRIFYNTNQPYTLIQYCVGQRREQYVSAIHARNFGDNLNFSFHFMRARSEGFYKRQNTSNTSVRTNLWYKGPAKRYAFLVDLYWTDVNVAENGGLANDTSFEFDEQLDRQVNEVNLNAAGTVQRKRGIWTKHIFAIGDVTDTLVLDTARSYNVITPAWGISLISELHDEKYEYRDEFPQGGFYDVVYRDTLLTQDSTYLWRVNNSVRLEKFNQNGKSRTRGYLGVRHEAGEYFNDTIYTHFQNVYAEASLQAYLTTDTGFNIQAGGYYVVSGRNKGNYAASGALTAQGWGGAIHGGVQLRADRLTPDYIFLRYSGNHLRWENDFSPVQRLEGKIYTAYRGKWLRYLSVAATVRITDRPVYFDSTFLPAQHSNSITLFLTQAQWNLKFGWFNSATLVNWAQTNNDTILRMPEFSVQHTMYADVRLFKKAMQLQAGIDIIWFSGFTAEAYMPAVAQFYLQNDRKVGNYAYISPWVSFRIKPVRVFLKVDHVNAGWFGRKYFLLDHYPANDLALKIGISWLFND